MAIRASVKIADSPAQETERTTFKAKSRTPIGVRLFEKERSSD
jgi:hypothetical protein